MNKTTQRLTNTLVGKLPSTGKDYRVWDAHTANLNVRVSPKGVKTFYFCYRNIDGKQCWPRIGRADALTVDEARKRARELQAQVDQGRDPLAERQQIKNDPTMDELWTAYLEQHARPKKKPASVKEDERLWRLHLGPRFKNEKVRSVPLAAIRKMHSEMLMTPGAANRCLALLSKMFSFAGENEWRDDNPCLKVKKYRENKRKRYLSDCETQRLWAALDDDHDQCAATIIKLLLLTGARKSEVMNMRWSNINIDTDLPTWTLPAGEQKGEGAVSSDLTRPLGPEASAILANWKRSQSVPSMTWVFPSPTKIAARRACFKKAWQRILVAAEITDLRVHDLRHSFASFAVNAGVSLEAIGASLGHKDVRTTQRYAHLKDETLRGVVGAVSAKVFGA